jgi:tRNA A37 threonylcarbamoyladenosine modification protein TsaB
MHDLLNLATLIDRGSYGLVLVLISLVMGWAYWQERKKNERLHAEILANSKEMVAVIRNVEMAVTGFKDALMSIRPYVLSPASLPPPPPSTYQRPVSPPPVNPNTASLSYPSADRRR